MRSRVFRKQHDAAYVFVKPVHHEEFSGYCCETRPKGCRFPFHSLEWRSNLPLIHGHDIGIFKQNGYRHRMKIISRRVHDRKHFYPLRRGPSIKSTALCYGMSQTAPLPGRRTMLDALEPYIDEFCESTYFCFSTVCQGAWARHHCRVSASMPRSGRAIAATVTMGIFEHSLFSYGHP